MVTNFIALAATKSKSGPWGKAQQSIDRSVRKKGHKYTKRRAIFRRKRHRRRAGDKERQGRTVYKANRIPNASVLRKYLYFNWGGVNSSCDEVCTKFKIAPNETIDVSHYTIVDSDITKHAMVIDDNNVDEIVFICRKVDTTQCHKVMRGV